MDVLREMEGVRRWDVVARLDFSWMGIVGEMDVDERISGQACAGVMTRINKNVFVMAG
jgi:hypothetical protein